MSDMQKYMTPGRRKACSNYSPEFKQQLVTTSCETENWRQEMALTPISCSNGVNNGARESCYYLLQRVLSYFLLSTTDEKWFFRNLGGRKWMKLSGEQGSKLF
ncbi:hypothetical protein QP300_21185 [Escherichia coli]|uniref:hypothetical protein n=1 Tax=Escherichia coli TaxID=562 RepID=UPI001C401AC8|nr:hypothetical protein [Escherichia coli]MDK6581304.1 hypothetical protein [Escherichia coli]